MHARVFACVDTHMQIIFSSTQQTPFFLKFFFLGLLFLIHQVQRQQRDVVLAKNIQRSTILDGDKNHDRILPLL